MRRLCAVVIAVLALGVLRSAASDRAREERPDPQWREIAWPMPRDGWPAGRAFRCTEAACGGDTELYVRPKLGFCNCDSGVADDDEVDRVADIDLLSPRFVPREAGRVVTVAEMSGRLRSYNLALPDRVKHAAVGIAVSHRCDLMIAVAQGTGDAPVIERAALEFLDTAEMRRWMASVMEGR
jgi:hypothetical protein